MMLGHTYAMEKMSNGKRAAVAALLSLCALTPQSAIADPTPTQSADPSRNPMEQYRIDRDIYNAAMKMRNLYIRNINIAFKNACDKAALDFKGAMSSAKTPDQKNIAANARKSAINSAIAARDAAISALGEEPVPPMEPMKPLKAPKGKSR
jgi:hypothetical protein